MAGLYGFFVQVFGLNGPLNNMMSADRLECQMLRAYRLVDYFLPGYTLITQMFCTDAVDIDMMLLNGTGGQFFAGYTVYVQFESSNRPIGKSISPNRAIFQMAGLYNTGADMAGLYSLISQMIGLDNFIIKMPAAYRLGCKLFRAYGSVLYFPRPIL